MCFESKQYTADFFFYLCNDFAFIFVNVFINLFLQSWLSAIDEIKTT